MAGESACPTKWALLLVALGAAAQTVPQTLTLRTQGVRFHEGEPIPFTVDVPHPDLSPDRMYQFAGFLLSPSTECGTLSQPCYDRNPGGLRPGGYTPVMGGELNRYVRGSLKPGRYRATALFVLEVLKASGPLSRTFGYTDPRQYIQSSAAEFEIVPVTLDWQRRTIAAAVKTLIEGDPDEGVQMRQAAAHELRYLQTPPAWEAELDQLDKSEYELLAGLENATDTKAVCGLMRTRLVLPRQYVSTNYLQALGRICGGTADEAAALLAAHLVDKAPAVRPAALDALMQYAAGQDATPAWLAGVRKEAIRQWPQMPEQRQKRYLEEPEWSVVRGPEMEPLLELLADTREPDVWRMAIRRLNEFAPAKAQSRIVAEMFRPASRIYDDTLALLPPEATRGLTTRLIQSLAGGDNHFTLALLARYGDGQALTRAKALFESHPGECEPELLAYFLRVDPAYADGILHRQPWDMHAPAPACAMRYFAVTARLYMSPELEKFMAAYLMHGDVQVKMMDAEALARYGTPAAEAPLWDTLRYFHDYWKDRRALLKENVEGEYLEVALRNAIARGAGWRATEADLRLIASLCISERCQYETANDLQNLQPPLEIQVEGDRSRLAQYYNIESMEGLEKKLAQFPAGTTFRLRVPGADRDQVVARLRKFGAEKGLTFQLTSY